MFFTISVKIMSDLKSNIIIMSNDKSITYSLPFVATSISTNQIFHNEFYFNIPTYFRLYGSLQSSPAFSANRLNTLNID